MAMIREYFERVEQHTKDYGEKTIVLWECGSFFEVYGLRNPETGNISPSAILTFAKICDFRIADKKNCIGKHHVVMAGFNNNILDKYLRKLDDAGFTVPIYTQEKTGGTFKRTLSFISSPGTYLTKEAQKITNNIMCCWIEKYPVPKLKHPYINCGLSTIDIFTGKSNLFEFQRENIHQPTTFDELERFYSIYNPSEIIFITKNYREKDVDDIIQFSGIQCANIHRISLDNPDDPFRGEVENCEKQTYQEELFKHFYNIQDYESFIYSLKLEEYPVATFSFCFLLEFVQKHNPALVKKIHEPVIDNINKRLVLANHSLQQLNILDNHQHKGKCSSVIHFMNRCKTPMGKRALHSIILHPITDVALLSTEYAIIDHAIQHFEDLRFIRDDFSQIRDIEKLYRKILMKHVTPFEFACLHRDVKIALAIFHTIKDDTVLSAYIAGHINEDIERSCQELITLLETTLDIEKAQLIPDLHLAVNCFKAGFSVELDTIERNHKEAITGLQTTQRQLCTILEKLERKKPKAPYVKINVTEKSMYSLVCTNRRAKLLHESLKKSKETYHLFPSGKNNRKIESANINKLCSTIHRTFSQLRERLAVEYNSFQDKIQEYDIHIETAVKYITLLDVLLSKAYVAKKNNYCRPEIDVSRERGFFDATEIRHPLIEHLQTNEIYVPNDISLGREKCGLVLFGTNAVGKSSLIRSIGITIILAQSGMFVPCSSLRFKPYTRLFTRILGNDNIFKGLSTFAVEMSELRTILNEADENSLILGDELCSGTETTSAIKIFSAGLITLHNRQSSFIFATHFHEIVELEMIRSLDRLAFCHMTVIYDREEDILVYERKLKPGSGNAIYGLEVCKSLKLSQEFMSLADSIQPYRKIIERKGSHYNTKKIKGGMCELCHEKIAEDIHHLMHQKEADTNGFIGGFHKNHKANLVNICKSCHDKIHKTNKQHRRVKTSGGMRVIVTT